jgi:hypothetical protein
MAHKTHRRLAKRGELHRAPVKQTSYLIHTTLGTYCGKITSPTALGIAYARRYLISKAPALNTAGCYVLTDGKHSIKI